LAGLRRERCEGDDYVPIWQSGTEPSVFLHIVGKLPTILLVLDADDNNAILKTFIHTNGEVFMQHAGDYTADKYFYLHDRLGSARQLFDPADLSVKNN